MGKVIMSGIVPQLEEPVTFAENFADNTWEQIIEACQKNKVPETWVVGDQKPMTINGTNYTIDIIGKNHDVYSDGSGTAPLTFQMHDCYATAYAMNSEATNAGGWASSAMRTMHLPAIMALMTSEVQAGVKEVKKLTCQGTYGSAVGGIADKLFLLSEIEVFGGITYSTTGEGTQFDYYKAGNSKVKKMNGSADTWWLRSPFSKSNSSNFIQVSSSGDVNAYNPKNAYSVAFAFCF